MTNHLQGRGFWDIRKCMCGFYEPYGFVPEEGCSEHDEIGAARLDRTNKICYDGNMQETKNMKWECGCELRGEEIIVCDEHSETDDDEE